MQINLVQCVSDIRNHASSSAKKIWHATAIKSEGRLTSPSDEGICIIRSFEKHCARFIYMICERVFQ